MCLFENDIIKKCCHIKNLLITCIQVTIKCYNIWIFQPILLAGNEYSYFDKVFRK